MVMSKKTATKIIWDKDNAVIFSVKFMKRSEADMISYLDKNKEKGIGKNTTIKLALREYMAHHPQD